MSQKWWVLAAVACGTFMATLDSSIVNITLPTLTRELGTDLYRIKWVVIVYLLVITCLLLPFGRLSDVYGRKRVLLLGFTTFTLSSAACGISPSLFWLVLCRGLQGIGAAALMANGPAVITAAFPGGERGKALGIMAMVVSAGLISGPSLGGLLIGGLGWRAVFLVNVPVGILGAVLVQRFVERDRAPHSPPPFDWAGTLSQMIALICFIAMAEPPIISVSGSDPAPVPRWVLAVAVVVFGLIFVKAESETESPVFDFTLLKNRTFWTGNLAGYLNFVAFSSLFILMPFFLDGVRHFGPHKVGAIMTAVPLTIFIVAPISGRLSDRLGSHGLSSAGAAIASCALLALSGVVGPGIDENTSETLIIGTLCSMGLGMGLFQSPNNNAIMGAVPANKLGVASALLAAVRNLGLVTGTGLSTAIFAWHRRITGDFVSAIHVAFFVAALVAACAMLASLGKPRGPTRTHPAAQDFG